MRRGPRNLRITTDGVGRTQFAGVSLLEQFVRRMGLRLALARHIRFAQRNNWYSISESLEALLDPLVLGLGRIETTEPLRSNGVFHCLAGLPGYPDATTLRRFLNRFARRGRNSFVKLHDAWRAAMLRPSAQAVFDLDRTVLTVYDHQERAEVGYNPKKRGRPSYLALLCLEGNTQDGWEGSYHPGDTHVSTITIPLLEHPFPKLPAAIREVRVRADSAFYDHEIIEFIEGKRAFYAIVARLTRPLKNRLSGLRYRQVASAVWAGEFQYCSRGWARGATLCGDPSAGAGRTFGPVELVPDGWLHLPGVGHQPYVAAPQPLAVLQPARRGGIDHPRIEIRLCPGEDSHQRLPGQRGVLPDCLAGLQLAELVPTPLRSTASAAGHTPTPPAALAGGARAVGTTRRCAHPAFAGELSCRSGFPGNTPTPPPLATAISTPASRRGRHSSMISCFRDG